MLNAQRESSHGGLTAPTDLPGATVRAAGPALVVVVDDQSAGRRILEHVIHGVDASIDVRCFADAAAALATLDAQTPDLIVTDYLMPGMDGLAFIRRVRSLPACRDVPVIVVTVVDDRQVRYDALEAGATDFLSRPIDEYECRVRCRNLLTLRRSHQELRRRGEQLARLSSQLSLTEQRERQRLAKVIHDDLQQLLVGASFSVQRVGRRLPQAPDMAKLREALAAASDLLRQATEVARRLVGDLSPPILHEAGLAEALEWLARRMRQRYGLEVELALDPSPPALSQDVRSVLFEAAREALFNVVKHAGTERVRLSLATGADGLVRLAVADQGVGFDVSAHPGDGDGDGGFGLFSIRERLHLLGGAFDIRSRPGAGTRVEVTAPLATAKSPAADSMPGAAASAADSVAAGAGAAPQVAVRILLVDDHAMMRRALSSMLAGEPGLSISGEAADGLDAIAAVEQTQPDLVLMDLTMPRLDGLEATRRIKQRWPRVRVIGLSMHEEADRAQAMLEAGAAAYVCKNGDVTQLLETIHRVSAGASAASPD